MAMDCALFYVDAEGMKGDSTVTSHDRQDTSEIMQVYHSLSSPRERASGMATGRRFHEPLSLVKRIDPATPLLLMALTNNQVLGELQLKWYRPNPMTGETEHFYTITLRNASVVKVETDLRFTRDPEQATYPPLEKVEFVYQEIEWTWLDGGLTHVDQWQTAGGGA